MRYLDGVADADDHVQSGHDLPPESQGQRGPWILPAPRTVGGELGDQLPCELLQLEELLVVLPALGQLRRDVPTASEPVEEAVVELVEAPVLPVALTVSRVRLEQVLSGAQIDAALQQDPGDHRGARTVHPGNADRPAGH